MRYATSLPPSSVKASLMKARKASVLTIGSARYEIISAAGSTRIVHVWVRRRSLFLGHGAKGNASMRTVGGTTT